MKISQIGHHEIMRQIQKSAIQNKTVLNKEIKIADNNEIKVQKNIPASTPKLNKIDIKA
jgi:hypothetical protein